MRLTDIDEVPVRIERMRGHAMSILSLIQELEMVEVHPTWDESRVKLYLDDAIRAALEAAPTAAEPVPAE